MFLRLISLGVLMVVIGTALAGDVIVQDQRFGRQRVTTIHDFRGMVRRALPVDPQIDRSRFERLPPPKEDGDLDVRFQDQPVAVAPPGKVEVVPAPADCGCRAETLRLTRWVCGRQMTDDRGRRWCLIQGAPQADKPAFLEGWMMQAADSPIYFFSKTGRMWRLVSLPLP